MGRRKESLKGKQRWEDRGMFKKITEEKEGGKRKGKIYNYPCEKVRMALKGL